MSNLIAFACAVCGKSLITEPSCTVDHEAEISSILADVSSRLDDDGWAGWDVSDEKVIEDEVCPHGNSIKGFKLCRECEYQYQDQEAASFFDNLPPEDGIDDAFGGRVIRIRHPRRNQRSYR